MKHWNAKHLISTFYTWNIFFFGVLMSKRHHATHTPHTLYSLELDVVAAVWIFRHSGGIGYHIHIFPI